MTLAQDIYPPCLELSQENEDLTQAAALDMFVLVKDGYFRTKVYNKTDDFPFHVVSLPFLESNIHLRYVIRFSLARFLDIKDCAPSRRTLKIGYIH